MKPEIGKCYIPNAANILCELFEMLDVLERVISKTNFLEYIILKMLCPWNW